MSFVDPYENCPYDESHRILRSRMAFHLTRCARQHPNSHLKQCPFDVRHVLDPRDYQAHVNNCSAREGVVHFAAHDQNAQHRQLSIIPLEAILPPPQVSNENWDTDPEVITYNPRKYIEEKLLLRPMIGGSKSEKKAFREAERRRIQELENSERVDKERRAFISVQKNTHTTKSKDFDNRSEKETVLRQPKNKSVSTKQNIENNNVASKPESSDESKEWPKITAATGAIPKTRSTNVEPRENAQIKSNASSQQSQEIKAPMSYASRLRNNDTKNSSFKSSINDENDEKENINLTDTSYASCSTADISIVDKITQDIHNITVEEEEFQGATKDMNETYNSLKNKAEKQPWITVKGSKSK